MKLKATQWNGTGYVQSKYEGRTGINSPMGYAGYIIENMYRDSIGSVMQLKFEYKEDLDDFWDIINHTKTFKILPVEAKNPEGYRIQCRYYSRSPSKPIALAHISEDTVVVWRVSIEEVIDHIPIKAILFNERFGDKFKIAKHDAYKKKLAQISLLEVLQNNLIDRQEELEEAQRELEKDTDESMSIAEEYGIEDIDDFMAWAKETYSKEE